MAGSRPFRWRALKFVSHEAGYWTAETPDMVARNVDRAWTEMEWWQAIGKVGS